MIVEIRKKGDKKSENINNVRSIRFSTNSFVLRKLGELEKKYSFKKFELLNVEKI